MVASQSGDKWGLSGESQRQRRAISGNRETAGKSNVAETVAVDSPVRRLFRCP